MQRKPGRPMGERHSQFEGIPRMQGACVYAVQLSNGLVKVGYSRNPRTRMCALSDYARREYRALVTAFHIGPELVKRTAASVEVELIERASAIATPVRGTREFFQHLHFGQAVNLIRQLAHREFVAA